MIFEILNYRICVYIYDYAYSALNKNICFAAQKGKGKHGDIKQSG